MPYLYITPLQSLDSSFRIRLKYKPIHISLIPAANYEDESSIYTLVIRAQTPRRLWSTVDSKHVSGTNISWAQTCLGHKRTEGHGAPCLTIYTPTPPAPQDTPWESKTPSNACEIEAQSSLICNWI
ncbi:hypothetical protein EJ02DRAFT_489765 [Clathrospora elynae]|uniref:Uncharacterized protein n=1 Tax=Clathrospora elynae TaxID=706981 RepID=A0A6A5SUW1_9PLEO|nr:hypothetical protein EJ02DRAFT_489765 [Clathrospora elynae]